MTMRDAREVMRDCLERKQADAKQRAAAPLASQTSHREFFVDHSKRKRVFRPPDTHNFAFHLNEFDWASRRTPTATEEEKKQHYLYSLHTLKDEELSSFGKLTHQWPVKRLANGRSMPNIHRWASP
mmetsp:Transcript_127325/g.224179  ORF Transcript_127325/g.224179 Transcript_127325/m.224179 type:complete len:126 (+) Transcript_127325:2-379(+)